MNKKGQDTTALFKNGKVMFLPEGTWMLSEMSKIKNFKWAETFTPQWDANHIVNWKVNTIQIYHAGDYEGYQPQENQIFSCTLFDIDHDSGWADPDPEHIPAAHAAA